MKLACAAVLAVVVAVGATPSASAQGQTLTVTQLFNPEDMSRGTTPRSRPWTSGSTSWSR